jgi:hypothetical protein
MMMVCGGRGALELYMVRRWHQVTSMEKSSTVIFLVLSSASHCKTSMAGTTLGRGGGGGAEWEECRMCVCAACQITYLQDVLGVVSTAHQLKTLEV